MIKYLYYKVYTFILKTSNKEIPKFASATIISLLIWINLFSINGFLAKIRIIPFYLGSLEDIPFYLLFGISTGLIYYYFNVRVTKIIEKYSQESDYKRMEGNLFVIFYIVLSFIITFVIISMKGELL